MLEKGHDILILPVYLQCLVKQLSDIVRGTGMQKEELCTAEFVADRRVELGGNQLFCFKICIRHDVE